MLPGGLAVSVRSEHFHPGPSFTANLFPVGSPVSHFSLIDSLFPGPEVACPLQLPGKGWMEGKHWETPPPPPPHVWQHLYSSFLSDWYFGGFVVCRFVVVYRQKMEGIRHYLQTSSIKKSKALLIFVYLQNFFLGRQF